MRRFERHPRGGRYGRALRAQLDLRGYPELRPCHRIGRGLRACQYRIHADDAGTRVAGTGIVFNEKTFRYAIPEDASSILPPSEDARADLLETRSSHGPFTCRLDDERVDRAIDAAGPSGMPIHFRFPSDDVPEFVQTFST